MVSEASSRDQKTIPRSTPTNRSWWSAKKSIQRFIPFIYLQQSQGTYYAHYWNSFVYDRQDCIIRRLSKVLSSLLNNATLTIFKWGLLSDFFKDSMTLMNGDCHSKIGIKLSKITLKSFVIPSCFCIKNQDANSLVVWIAGNSGQRLWSVLLKYKGTELSA